MQGGREYVHVHLQTHHARVQPIAYDAGTITLEAAYAIYLDGDVFHRMQSMYKEFGAQTISIELSCDKNALTCTLTSEFGM